MTEQQRSDLVILLRCAADIASAEKHNRGSALGMAAQRLDMSNAVPVGDGHWTCLLGHAVKSHPDRGWWVCGPGYEFCLLEAAQRVEEGNWP